MFKITNEKEAPQGAPSQLNGNAVKFYLHSQCESKNQMKCVFLPFVIWFRLVKQD